MKKCTLKYIKTDSNDFCYDFTHWNSQKWWLTLFCNGDIFHNHESVNTLQIKC